MFELLAESVSINPPEWVAWLLVSLSLIVPILVLTLTRK